MAQEIQGIFMHDGFLHFEKIKNFIKIYIGIQILYLVNLKNIIEVRIAIVHLRNIGISVNKLSKIFNLHRQTITDWYSIYLAEGIQALDDIKSGPKKINSEIVAYIIAKFNDLNFVRHYKNIICEKVKELYGITIHWASVSKILKKNKIDLSVKKNNKKLNTNEFETDNVKREFSEYAGLFLIFPFLKDFDFKTLFSDFDNIFKNKYYQMLDYFLGLILLLTSNLIKVEENIKNYSDKNLGVIIGKNNFPSLNSYRENLKTIINNVDIKKFEYMLCQKYFASNKECRELYIDGHFLPYYGLSNIFKGYNPIRRFAMKGRMAYFLNNAEGRPFFFILSNGYKGFREYLKEIVLDLENITDRKDILLIFDRGGYGKDFCDDLSKDCEFICWKLGKINLPEKPNWQEITLEHQGNEYGETVKIKVEACERLEIEKDKVKREIWIKKGDKISPAFTNNNNRSLESLVIALTNRWALQENIFKALKGMGIDAISSYKKELYPENWLFVEDEIRKVANPQKKIIKEKLNKIKKEMKVLNEKAGKKYFKGQINKSLSKIKQELEIKEKEFQSLKNELDKMPDKIEITELIKSKGIIKLDAEKKKFLDLVKILSYNAQQDIVDFIIPIYKDRRDVNMFVRQLLRKSGEIIISESSVKIIFKKFSSRRKTKSLKYLCDKINDMNFPHPILNKKIAFEVI